eukprot:scaffold37723_cov69-Phaeocystis_antarctica.AAC.3
MRCLRSRQARLWVAHRRAGSSPCTPGSYWVARSLRESSPWRRSARTAAAPVVAAPRRQSGTPRRNRAACPRPAY